MWALPLVLPRSWGGHHTCAQRGEPGGGAGAPVGQAGKVGGFQAAGAGSSLLPRVFMRQASSRSWGQEWGPGLWGRGVGRKLPPWQRPSELP